MPADSDSITPVSSQKIWRNILLFAGSAAFGGLAIALWNRRELAQFQKERNREIPIPASSSDSDEETI